MLDSESLAPSYENVIRRPQNLIRAWSAWSRVWNLTEFQWWLQVNNVLTVLTIMKTRGPSSG